MSIKLLSSKVACLLAVIILSTFSSSVNGEVVFDWNDNGDSGQIWTGWNYSADVNNNESNNSGFFDDNAAAYVSCTRAPRLQEKTDHGDSSDFMLDTADISPSTSTGSSLKVFATGGGGIEGVSYWFFWPENLLSLGISTATSNSMDLYMKVQNIADIDFSTMDRNFMVGVYLASEGSECIDGGDGEGPGNRKYYHNMTVQPGSWIHVILNDHPETIRDPGDDPILPVDNYFQDLDNIYFETFLGDTFSDLVIVNFDEWHVYANTEDHNNVTVGWSWVGYWAESDRWYIAFADPYTSNQYGGGSLSTFEIRYSVDPITNANFELATIINPEVNGYVDTDHIRRPATTWTRTIGTYFYIPDEVEKNSVLYFAIKDVSSVSNGDAHNGADYIAQTYISTISYDLAWNTGSKIIPGTGSKIIPGTGCTFQ